ncbi:hypothetical protein PVK06_043052 [Gossypium arboreum]|uniref:Exo_endo_phos domain-containing protein n=1 Tax=Gossypium arboreum TaxID=29729 RepID=A0ABR0MMI9_GOSAR|nr:hypothetical protein PVK06_043052 [Gossypium arboreum]
MVILRGDISYPWNFLQRPGTDQSLPWLVVGDFNEITYSFEKSGERVRGERQMQDFQSALLDCDLHDLGQDGRWYTWEREKFEAKNIRECLDRAVVNSS